MPNRLFTSGIPLPSLCQLLLAGAAIAGGWLLWTEFRERRAPPGTASTAGTPVEAVQRFERLISRGRDAVPELIGELTDPLPRTRRFALYALGRIGSDASAAAG